MIPALAGGVAFLGCNRPQEIQVDLSADEPRFIIDHAGWPRPFRVPRVNEFAIGAEEDGVVAWHLKSGIPGGEPADNLAIVYGRVPSGFYQVVPAEDAAPKSLVPGRTYLVAAGGDEQIYRIVLALPVSVKRSDKASAESEEAVSDRAE